MSQLKGSSMRRPPTRAGAARSGRTVLMSSGAWSLEQCNSCEVYKCESVLQYPSALAPPHRSRSSTRIRLRSLGLRRISFSAQCTPTPAFTALTSSRDFSIMGNCLGREAKGQRLGSGPSSGAPSAAASSSAPSAAGSQADRDARAAAAEARLAAAASRGTGGAQKGPGQLGKKLAEQQRNGGTSAAAKDRDGPGVERVVVSGAPLSTFTSACLSRALRRRPLRIGQCSRSTRRTVGLRLAQPKGAKKRLLA